MEQHPRPLVLLGDFNKDTLRRPAYQVRLKSWGYTAYSTGWMWAWRGARAHTHNVPFVNRPFESEIHGTVNFTQFCCVLLVTWCYRVLLSCYLRPK